MTRFVKWLPAIVAPVVVAGVVAAPAFAGQASGVRTTPSAASVLALVAKAKDAHYSGTLQQTSDLGLPDLPSSMSTGSGGQTTSILELLTAPHSARVYVDGPNKQRLQVLDSLAERDVIRNGRQVWSWNSKNDTAVHVTLPTMREAQASAPSATPQSVADQLIARAGEDTRFRVSQGAVAGRSVWTLTATPKTSGTLVSKAVVSVDEQTGVPLAAELDARGQQKAAVSIAFTTIDFGMPQASNFSFTPPAGARVKDKTPPAHAESPDHQSPGSFEGPTVTGSGWSSVVEVPASAQNGGSGLSGLTGSQSKLLDELTQHVAGGRGLQTSLFSVLIKDDGTVYAGAVPLSALESAAG